MTISIVLPAYNAENYIKQSIESVLNQTKDCWELVIVNDGSIDNTATICDRYVKEYPEKIKLISQENKGQFLARLCGIEQSKGEYIGFLDADDVLDENYIRCIEKYLCKDEPDILCFGFIEERVDTSITHSIVKDKYLFKTREDKKEIYEHIVKGDITGAMWSKVFKRELLLMNYKGQEEAINKRYGEDSFQSFSAFREAKTICFIEDLLYRYRIREESASQGFESRELDYFNTKYVFQVIFDCMRVWGVDSKEHVKKMHAKNFNETVYYMLRFYRSAKNRQRRKDIITYDWSTYLVDTDDEKIINNEYVRKSYVRVWNAFKKKQFMNIYIREKFKRYIGW